MLRRHTLCKPHNRISPVLSSQQQCKVNKVTGGQVGEKEFASDLRFIMSGKESLGRGGPAVAKLKEGLQEAIVFLQTLGSYRIPAVIERRRKELLDKLTLLQGGSLKDASLIDPDIVDTIKTSDKSKEPESKKTGDKSKEPDGTTKDKAESSESSSTTSSTVTSPNHGKSLKRRDSAVVSSLVKDYECISHSARKEEEKETPKRFVTLKRVAKPTDFPASVDKDLDETQGAEESQEKKSKVEEDGGAAEGKGEVTVTLDVADVTRERAASVVSGEESNDEEEGDDRKKKKKNKKGGGFGLKVKGFMKREKSPVPERKNRPRSAGSPSPSEAEKKEEEEQNKQEETAAEEIEEVQEEEEGVRISGVLGRMKKKGKGKSAKQVHAKVCETTLMLGGKEELDLIKCSVEVTDVGFDLTHPQHKSAFWFKVEGDEEQREKWVSALKEAIEKATPPEEEKSETEDNRSIAIDSVPSITVEDVGTPPASKKGKRESKVLIVKPEKKLPDQGVEKKGNFLRKKPGISRSWEKTHCVLTYQAFYFSGEADTKDYSNMLPIYPNMDVKIESKKGKGDNPGLCVKMGKKQEYFSFESKADCQGWKSAIENVLGLGGVEELLSEDEEGNAGPEDLYEELELDDVAVPQVPASPRPSRPSFAAPPTPIVQDDFAIDEDIYEETDDILPTLHQTSYHQSPQHMPSLPNRNPPKNPMASAPMPSLPPRNPASAAPGPSLPLRGGAGRKPKPMEYESTAPLPQIGAKPGAKAPAPPITAATVDEDQELYDDVVVGEQAIGGGEDAEEMYDDVVMGGDDPGEELYDDVMTTSGLPTDSGKASEPISEEFYEDMAPGAVSDPYVALEKNVEELEPGEELYVDVDVDEPAAAPIQTLQNSAPQAKSSSLRASSKKTNKKTPNSGGTMSRGLVSGSVGYKAPKKSKFDEKWGCVEGSNLLVFKSSGDKKHQDKIPLGDSRLDIGSTEAGAGKFAFSLSKGDKLYHFSLRSSADVDSWVSVLKGIVKYAPVEVGNGAEEEPEIYQAREDHIADSDGELTFKKGTLIKLIEHKSKDMWYGQIGNDAQVFEGKKGIFPVQKVELAEDLYI